jgi:hypothetical protein
MIQIVKRKDLLGDYEEVWHCEQPELYVVLDEEWNDDKTVRIVYEIEERPE